MSQFCSVTLKILFWKLQEATYCAHCISIVRHSTRTIGSAKVRHSTCCKTMLTRRYLYVNTSILYICVCVSNFLGESKEILLDSLVLS